MSAEEEDIETNYANFVIPVLRILKKSQLQHGLRHGDYQRYRQFLSKKIRRMRKCLDFRFGNRSKVTVKKLTVAIINDSRYLMLRIFEIERCWAYSMQLKDEASKDSRKRFHAKNRMRKGVKLADELSEIIKEMTNLDSSTLLEIKAYTSMIKGQFFFDKEEWVIAKEFLDTSKKIYSGLSESLTDESKEIYSTKCEEINPQIRYCAYNCGDQTAKDSIKKVKNIESSDYLDALLKSCSKEDVEKITEVNWFDQSIPVKNEQVKMFILSLGSYEQELDSVPADEYLKKISIYESNILKGCSEAIAALKEEIKLSDTSVNNAVASATGDLSGTTSKVLNNSEKSNKSQFLLNYLLWLKNKFVISRYLLQIKSALKPCKSDIITSSIGIGGPGSQLKPNELARLYDSVMQSLTDIAQINGPPKDNEIISDILKAKQLAYRCFRCYYLALAHFNNKSFVQCLGLLQRSRENIGEFMTLVKSISKNKLESQIPGDSFDVLKVSLTKLDERCQAEELTCKAQRILQIGSNLEGNNDENEEEKVDKKPLFEKSKEFFTEKQVEKIIGSSYCSLVNIVPDFEPVPMKPIFFDLALNYIDYPNMASLSGANSKNQSGEESKGLTGIVKGWLWGS